MEELSSKANERNRKARQRLEQVLCDCSLCKALEVFGERIAKTVPSTSPINSGSDNEDELGCGSNIITSTHDSPVHNNDENGNIEFEPHSAFDCASNSYYVYELDNKLDEEEQIFDNDDKAPFLSPHDRGGTRAQDETYEKVRYNSCHAKMPLYPESGVTVLETLARYFQWFTEHPGFVEHQDTLGILAMHGSDSITILWEPHWKRMYGNSRISEMLQSHGAPATCTEKDNMQDVHDSPLFQEAYKVGQNGDAALKIDSYVEVLVDELLEFSVGVPMYDGYQSKKFDLKVRILNHVLDYSGLNKLFSATGANALKGCLWCDVQSTCNYFLIIYNS
ncbi:Hypothetical predicted protein [Paramuricea clavata]|uniref:Uncharacterized protein n=1 Tax=Paramuricea clavata TaxID=317549 RepID=A0A6S7FU21_PARCT|nr:Hypothetical predicted protein [Paramuricea clavata]